MALLIISLGRLMQHQWPAFVLVDTVIGEHSAAIEDTETTAVIKIVVSKDSPVIRSAETTVAINIEIGETALWLNVSYLVG